MYNIINLLLQISRNNVNRNLVEIINEYGETVLHHVRDAEVARLILTANPDLVNIKSMEGDNYK